MKISPLRYAETQEVTQQMPNENTERTFPLDVLPLPAALLGKVAGASGIDSSGPWNATYGMFSATRRLGQHGTMEIRRRTEADGAALTLKMLDGQCPPYTQKVDALIHCKADTLSTPTKWRVTEEMFGGDRPVALTKISKSAVAKNGRIEITDTSGTQTIAVKGPYTINWALYDAAGRLGRKDFKPVRFDLIDHFDQFKGDQEIRYRASKKVKLGRSQVMLHAFDHVGFGIVPWTYYLSDGGLVVLAVGGLEIYALLEAAAPKGGDR